MAMAPMNRITISLIFLIMISMVLPTSAIMYASGSTDNTDGTSDSEFSENSFASNNGSTDDNTDGTSDSGSTDNDGAFPTTSTESSDALPIDPTVINSTGNEQLQNVDLENTILNIHNQERAAVNVPTLSWSSSLASNAQSWADQLLAEGKFEHSPDTSYGENIAQLSRINPNPNEIDLILRWYNRGSMKRIHMMVNQLLMIILCSSVITRRWSGNPLLKLVAGWPVILVRTF